MRYRRYGSAAKAAEVETFLKTIQALWKGFPERMQELGPVLQGLRPALRAVVESSVDADGNTKFTTVVRSLPTEKDDPDARDPNLEDPNKTPYAGFRTYYHRREFGKDVGKYG